jgi:hypothetical protein
MTDTSERISYAAANKNIMAKTAALRTEKEVRYYGKNVSFIKKDYRGSGAGDPE